MRRAVLVLPIISALALVGAFPRFGLWPLAWVALVPLFVVYRRSSLGTSLLATLVVGLVFFGGLMSWVAIFGYAPWFLSALLGTLFLVAFCAVALPAFRWRAVWARLLFVPAVWTAFEWLRSLGVFGCTWGDLAQSQTQFTAILQMASVTGQWGLSFIIAAVNVALAELWPAGVKRKRAIAPSITVVLAVFAIAVSGWVVMSRGETRGRPVRVAIIQGNVEQELRANESWHHHIRRTMASYTGLTVEALRHSPNLIVWPETAVPGCLGQSPPLQAQVASLARTGASNLLVGGADYKIGRNGKPRFYNGAFLYAPNGEFVGVYYKAKLVPFGEFVPGRKWIPFLDRYPVRDIDYSPGPGFFPLKTDFGRLGVMICFESTFPQVSLGLTRNGANILVVMTNDAWFERTAAADQHLAMAVLRAIENRRYVVRCAATGISGVIDPWGRVIKSAGIFERKTIHQSVVPSSATTLYTRFGDWFAHACAAATTMAVVFVVISILRRRKGRSGAVHNPD